MAGVYGRKKLLQRNSDGTIEWEAKDVIRYEVTGIDVYGKRFKRSFQEWRWAKGINLWRGSKWAVDTNGHRHLITRVYN